MLGEYTEGIGIFKLNSNQLFNMDSLREVVDYGTYSPYLYTSRLVRMECTNKMG